MTAQQHSENRSNRNQHHPNCRRHRIAVRLQSSLTATYTIATRSRWQWLWLPMMSLSLSMMCNVCKATDDLLLSSLARDLDEHGQSQTLSVNGLSMLSSSGSRNLLGHITHKKAQAKQKKKDRHNAPKARARDVNKEWLNFTADGPSYFGELRDGLPHGHGVLTHRNAKFGLVVMDGEWRKGELFRGQMDQELGNRSQRGEFQRNKLYGQGRNREWLQEQQRWSFFQGISRCGRQWSGKWESILECEGDGHGEIKEIWESGQFVTGKLRGRAQIRYYNGDVLEAEVVDGKIDMSAARLVSNTNATRNHDDHEQHPQAAAAMEEGEDDYEEEQQQKEGTPTVVDTVEIEQAKPADVAAPAAGKAEMHVSKQRRCRFQRNKATQTVSADRGGAGTKEEAEEAEPFQLVANPNTRERVPLYQKWLRASPQSPSATLQKMLPEMATFLYLYQVHVERNPVRYEVAGKLWYVIKTRTKVAHEMMNVSLAELKEAIRIMQDLLPELYSSHVLMLS